MGTFIIRLVLAPADFIPPVVDDPARQVPTISSYENLIERPLNVGGRLSGSGSVYVTARSKRY
jgi:hypothetical protein